MKILETNSEQWEIRESGVATVVVGVIMAVAGVILLGWALMHLASIAWWWTLVGAGVAGIGVLMLFSAVSRQITLRRQGLNEVVMTKVVGRKQTRASFDASQIVSVNLDTSDALRTDNDAQGQTTTRERSSILYVLLNDNSEVMLATGKSSGGNGVSINGFNLSGISKAPLADEAQRIASFYGVPLSSRANNASGVEIIASVASAVKQGITSAGQQGVAMNAQPQPQVPAQPRPIITPPAVQPIAPVETPPLNGSVTTQPSTPESVNTGEQLSR